jgi:hypothetical protein
MLASRLPVLAIVGTVLAACAEVPDAPGPEARACAELAAFYLGESRPVELTSHESEPGRVRIDYRSGGQDGVALCQVKAREDGMFEVTGALVDENRLREDEISAFAARQR